jgi:hypothetical protein
VSESVLAVFDTFFVVSWVFLSTLLHSPYAPLQVSDFYAGARHKYTDEC